ncbi:dolichyl-P-Man:Man(5)GlcNAc(2)-PP-dolichol alpha-1,3-mannosyltransferase [Cadophora gregata]|uniref:dolichyl-P-Man:Man(5)GlcNAc(2)-PP-dolichol alpha-1,3-mannosyltransferase n=1 Tax=Cadophora gregata TaxID=51156 RepID=UPI0026DD4CCD|nr:dolichyl-P-Man:Man(5)GlcNAc(2)-PP-dolichol alpha-1,3-mannosyltransferase [Cadophora gregata]KAK0119770.1 dolichyl-P-Man:Man(5)GlcNAc(2)-PP-dolichol alpha-1,3-mannosyltransferase [Cadophora gregata]KAK0120802.1 dolichyl-P-Man:Man(5)GlcNAc(2)-PP-dolichol alpha-1,3-mannosyltransferase [Cadophora gregata f. sp. sojae]
MATESSPPVRYVSYPRQAKDLAMGVHPLSRYVPPLLLLADAFLTSLIIYKVSYTEIDWKAYMEQVEQYVNGERDYTKIKGGTGPLVYPAVHVYIYLILYHFTDKGRNILVAQRIFGVLYLATLAVVMACYRRAKAPLYIFPMLVMSKRLHSIFVLRLFNDCFAVFFLWVAIYMFQRRIWTIGGLLYSLGIGVKMSLLLSLPAVGVVLFLGRGLQGSLKQAYLMAQLQFVIAFPFLPENPMGYLGRAFEFSRVFLFRWTVNWRFLGEETFLSKEFSYSLLVGHASTLLLFVTTRWLKPAEKPWSELIRNALKFQEPCGKLQHAVSIRVSPNYILTTILTANAIGMLFARSLHYQFYAYIALATPFLLWRSGMHPIFQYGLWAAQEWAWNVYPSTDVSSKVVVGVLAATVMRMWWGTRTDFVSPKGEGAASKKFA